MLPAIQYPPCRRPKAAEETKSANHEKRLKETESKSDEIRRRMRKPRNAKFFCQWDSDDSGQHSESDPSHASHRGESHQSG